MTPDPTDEPRQLAARSPRDDAVLDEAREALSNGPVGALVVAGIAVGLLFAGWLAFYFFLFMPRAPLAESSTDPLGRPLPDGIISEEIIDRTERRWLMAMAAMLAVMLAVIVVTGVASALHPPSNLEIVDPQTLHLRGEFVESNLGTTIEPDGSVTVRVIAEQYDFVPRCIRVPAGAPVKFRLTSADVVHGFLLPDTNVNTMVVPGFVAEVRTRFTAPGDYVMPCHEFCGLGHHAMWAHVSVLPAERFENLTPLERTSCASE